MLLGVVLGFARYDGSLPTQPEAALSAIQYIFILIPIVADIIALILMSFYDLDNRREEIAKKLEAKTK